MVLFKKLNENSDQMPHYFINNQKLYIKCRQLLAPESIESEMMFWSEFLFHREILYHELDIFKLGLNPISISNWITCPNKGDQFSFILISITIIIVFCMFFQAELIGHGLIIKLEKKNLRSQFLSS